MSSVIPAILARRKRLISQFDENDATCKEKAVTLQEIHDKWEIKVIRPLRMRAITLDTHFLCRSGKLAKTEDGKYYLDVSEQKST